MKDYKDIFIFGLLICTASIASILLKLGADRFIFTWNPFEFLANNYLVVIGYVLYVLPSVITLYLYKKYKVGFVQAIGSGIYILTPVLAFFLVNEKFNFLKIFGILVIFTSIMILALTTDSNEKH